MQICYLILYNVCSWVGLAVKFQCLQGLDYHSIVNSSIASLHHGERLRKEFDRHTVTFLLMVYDY